MRLSPRTRDLAELAIGYGLILTTIWTPNPAQRILYWTAFTWIAITAALRWKETAPNGLGCKGLLGSLWVVAAAIAVFLGAIALAHHLHTLHRLYGPLPVVEHIAGYALWALMQQFILQVYVLLRLFRLDMTRKSAIVFASVLFAIAHIPNPRARGRHAGLGRAFLPALPSLSQPVSAGIRARHPRHVSRRRCAQSHPPPHARRPRIFHLPHASSLQHSLSACFSQAMPVLLRTAKKNGSEATPVATQNRTSASTDTSYRNPMAALPRNQKIP